MKKTNGSRSRLLTGILALCLSIALLLGGCGAGGSGSGASEEKTEKDYSKLVADESEMIDEDEVVLDGMEAIEGSDLKDGAYPILVSTSSTMFPVTDCTLTVKDGVMTAEMVMSGTGYLYVYPGTGLEAAKAEEKDRIPFAENAEGKHTFTIPVPALNAAVPCAAFSKRKEKWYNRLLCFRADSLPLDTFKDGVLTTRESLNLEPGEYSVDVILGGGSGRADIESPAILKVDKDSCLLRLTWSSENYDYMLVKGERYDPVNKEGNSVFEIPVEVFDMPFAVVADTTAMSQPYEIDYTLRLDSSSITKQ